MANRAAKGPAFERWFCKELSKWWTQDFEESRDDIFWRTSGSGARATGRTRKNQKTANSYGDVMAIDPIGKPLLDVVTIECKRGRSGHTIQDLLDAPEWIVNQVYYQWFAQAREDAKASGSLQWLLVVRRDRRDALVFWENGPLTALVLVGSLPLLTFHGTGKDDNEILATTLAAFLTKVHPDALRNLAKELTDGNR